MLALYKGTTSPLIGVGAVVSLQFGVCENIKKVFSHFSDTPHRMELSFIYASGVLPF
jgi:solute carrier family 25 carnitine/acylcarnitine transporter 20/29